MMIILIKYIDCDMPIQTFGNCSNKGPIANNTINRRELDTSPATCNNT